MAFLALGSWCTRNGRRFWRGRCRVYRHGAGEDTETRCGCGGSLFTGVLSAADAVAAPLHQVHDVGGRGRDLPWNIVRPWWWRCIACDRCRVRVERINCPPRRRSASDSEEIVGEACESAAASQVARRCRNHGARHRRYLERWDQRRRKPRSAETDEWMRYTGGKRSPTSF